ATGASPDIRVKSFMALLLPARLGRLREERDRLLDAADTLHVRGAVFVRPADEDMVKSLEENQGGAGRRRCLSLGLRRHRAQGGHEFACLLRREVAQPAGALVDTNLAARQFDDGVFVAIVDLCMDAGFTGPHRRDRSEPETENCEADPERLHEGSLLKSGLE